MNRLAGEIEHIWTRVVIITEETQKSNEVKYDFPICPFGGAFILRMLQKANYIEIIKLELN